MIVSMLERTGALLSGHFRLSSGLHSDGYVQCARLLEYPSDAAELGRLLAASAESFGADRIVAPAMGGLIIGFTVAQALDLPMIFTERKDGAMALRRGFTLGERRRVLIVEDVVTTGKSSLETARVIESLGGSVTGYASILNRSGQENPFGVPYAFLHRMDLGTWNASECPLCAEGRALETPGSRFASA